jgi:Xaa-Pro aminopeptidase
MNDRLKSRHHEIVTERLRSLMEEEGLDVLLALKNDNFTYINTAASPFLSQSGFASIAMIVVPREGEVFGICPDFERPAVEGQGMVPAWYDYPVWIYIDDQFVPDRKSKKESEKEEFFSLGSSVGMLADRLRAAGLHRGRVGVEMMSIQAPVWEALQGAVPDATFVDSSQVFYESRSVKTDYEIECLRYGSRVQEDVVFETMSEVQVGVSHGEIMSRLRSKALAAEGIDSIRFMYVSAGPLFAPTVSAYDVSIRAGDLVKYDGALVVRGYGADAAWTFVAGKPSPDQERVNHALLSAHRAAVEMMGPGVIPKDVFNKAMEVARREGLPDYVRGHVGHSVGLDQTIEEPPLLSAASEQPMRAGNVFCVELPYYAHGFGSIQNEDIVLITEEGRELLTKREKRLYPIGTGP